MPTVRINLAEVVDFESFHRAFATAFGFPGFYGKNMNAWIDCMGYLDDPSAGMSDIHVAPGETLMLELHGTEEFAARCPEQFHGLIICTAFVNDRAIAEGLPPLLALVFSN